MKAGAGDLAGGPELPIAFQPSPDGPSSDGPSSDEPGSDRPSPDEDAAAAASPGEVGPGEGDSGDTDTAEIGPEAGIQPARSPSPYRRAGFAATRALVVLGVAFVGYQLVVPTVHVERGRLARLVPTKPGVAAFDKTAPQQGAMDDTATGLAAMTAAAKHSPNQTGVYSIQWLPNQTSGIGVAAFLLPNDATAATTFAQARGQQLSPGSFSSSQLTRTSTFTVAAVPGATGAVYATSPKAGASQQGLAVALFRYGKVVALVDVASSNATDKAAAETVAAGEYANLHRLGSGFSLSVTRRPVVPTVLWIVGAVVLAAIAALAPVMRRRRAEKRRRAYEEEMAHRVVVGRQVIVKHRR
jgi:hypothetical protein